MKQYNSLFEFILGLVGLLIQSLIVLLILSYLAFPEMIQTMIDVSSGNEKAMLMSFVDEVKQIQPILYLGTAIILFEWIALFKILKYENKLTPIWSAYLVLGALYAFFYFGGLEVFILLLISGSLSLYKYFKHYGLNQFRSFEE